MKNDLLVKLVEFFFRFLSWFYVLVGILFVFFLVGFLRFPTHMINSLAQAHPEVIIPHEIQRGHFIPILCLWMLCFPLGYFMFRTIWQLIHYFRKGNGVSEWVISHLKFFSYLLVCDLIMELAIFIIEKVTWNQLEFFYKLLDMGQTNSVNWTNFIFPDFNAITSFFLFLLTSVVIRFLKHYMAVKAEQELTV